MKLWSPAWSHGDALRARPSAGRLLAEGRVVASDRSGPPLNRALQLA